MFVGGCFTVVVAGRFHGRPYRAAVGCKGQALQRMVLPCAGVIGRHVEAAQEA